MIRCLRSQGSVGFRFLSRLIFADSAHRRGFTLIELLVSGVLTVVLMAALLRVLQTSVHETRHAESVRSMQPTTGLLVDQLRRDIRNARGMRVAADRLELYGPLGHDAARMPTLRSARVSYGLTGTGNAQLLVRVETDASTLASRPQVEAIWYGVSRVEVSGLGAADEAPRVSPAETGGLPPMPPLVLVRLLDSTGRVIIDVTIIHHEEL